MLVKPEELQDRYRSMDTAELLDLAADEALSDTARYVLNEELQARNAAPDIGRMLTAGKQRRRLRRRHAHYVPDLWHRLIHLWAALLAPPLLYVAGWLHPAILTASIILAWWLSSYLVRGLWRAPLPPLLYRCALWGLPLFYGLLYYGIYTVLYAHIQA